MNVKTTIIVNLVCRLASEPHYSELQEKLEPTPVVSYESTYKPRKDIN